MGNPPNATSKVDGAGAGAQDALTGPVHAAKKAEDWRLDTHRKT